jgi:hypothetical protein
MNPEFHSSTGSTIASTAADILNNNNNNNSNNNKAGLILLPELPQRIKAGLAGIPADVLEQWLEPILRSLQSINPETLLNLQQVQEGAQINQG